VAVAHDAALVAERLVERLAQGDADVLDRVVMIDVHVALGLDHQVDQAVARDLLQHVLEEGDAGVEARGATAVQTDLDHDPGFARVTADAGATADGGGGTRAHGRRQADA
jgi:hypothetical protein